MTRITEYTRRDRRNALIMELRGKGWSLRRIGRHPDVQLSVSAVHEIATAAEAAIADDDDDDNDGDNESAAVAEGVERTGDLRNALELYRAVYANDPPDPAAVAAWRTYKARIEELTAAFALDRYGATVGDLKHWERGELHSAAVKQAQAELSGGGLGR